MNFYRGVWCSYCQCDLRGLERAMSGIRLANASVVAISHQVASDVSCRVRQAYKLSFALLDDANGYVAEQLGIRWAADDSRLIETKLGFDLVTLRGIGPWILPMQARYVIGQDGIIIFAEVAFDYSQRSEHQILPILMRLNRSATVNRASVLAA